MWKRRPAVWIWFEENSGLYAPSTHLSRKGVTSDALLHRKIQASVLAAQIVGDVLGFGLLGGLIPRK